MGDLVEGVHCWGCARRFVPKGLTDTPPDRIRWREGLCGKKDCAIKGIVR